MNAMKKAFALVLSLCLLLACTACGGSLSVPDSTAPSGSASAPEAPADSAPQARTVRVAGNLSGLSLDMGNEFCDKLEELSGGALVTERYLTGQVGTNDEDLCIALSEGNFDVYLTSDMFATWVLPEWLGYANVAFCFRDAAHMQSYWKMLNEECSLNDKLVEQYNVRAFVDDPVAVRTPRYITANRKITSPADMVGLKFRTPSVEGVVASWEACGASIVPVPFGELFSALQTGTADAQENPTDMIQQGGFYEVQDYLMLTGHQFGAYIFYANESWYQTLSEEEKGWASEAAASGYELFNVKGAEQDAELLKTLEDEGMTIVPAEEIDIDAFKQAIIQPVLDKFKGTWAEGGWDKIQAL